MNINKHNISIAKCASKGKIIFNDTIHFTKDYTEATDGHVLARMTYPQQIAVDEVPDAIKTQNKEHIKDFCVSAAEVNSNKFRKGRFISPRLKDVYIDVEHTNNTTAARFVSTDLETTPTIEIRKEESAFPETDVVFPKEEPIFEIKLDARKLRKVCDIVAELVENGVMNLTFYGKERPVKVTAIADGQEFIGLISPIK